MGLAPKSTDAQAVAHAIHRTTAELLLGSIPSGPARREFENICPPWSEGEIVDMSRPMGSM